jgi:hypothetical protein
MIGTIPGSELHLIDSNELHVQNGFEKDHGHDSTMPDGSSTMDSRKRQ